MRRGRLNCRCGGLSHHPLGPHRRIVATSASYPSQEARETVFTSRYVASLHSTREGSVDDGRALVFDVVEAGALRDRPRLRRDDPELEPERLGPGRHGFVRDFRAKLGPAEDVDDVDRLFDLGERRDAGDAQHLRYVWPHRDDPVPAFK
jgi:hypothetical protein